MIGEKWFPEGILIGSQWSPIILKQGDSGLLEVSGQLLTPLPTVFQKYVNVTEVANVGGGTDNLMSWTMPTDFMHGAGDGFWFKATGHAANSAGAKTVKMLLNAVELGAITIPENVANGWVSEGEVLRLSATEVHAHVRLFDVLAAGGLGTQWAEFHSTQTLAPGEAAVWKFTGAAVGATDGDIDQDSLTILAMS